MKIIQIFLFSLQFQTCSLLVEPSNKTLYLSRKIPYNIYFERLETTTSCHVHKSKEPPLDYLSSHNKYHGSGFIKLRSIYVFENLFFLNLTFVISYLLCGHSIIMLFCSKNLKVYFQVATSYIFIFDFIFVNINHSYFFCFLGWKQQLQIPISFFFVKGYSIMKPVL